MGGKRHAQSGQNQHLLDVGAKVDNQAIKQAILSGNPVLVAVLKDVHLHETSICAVSTA